MNIGMAKRLGAMIIGLALAAPAAAQFWARDPAALPTPLAFVTTLEVGDLRQAQAVLDAGLPPDFMGSRIGSGLMIGAWEGNIEMMRLFISRGADINRMNGNGETALILASWRGHLDAVKWLVERGARINPPPRQWSALHYAAFNGHRDVADYLLAEGANINALSTNGSSVLMMAIYEGREDMARLLIERGADRSVKNEYGDGALEWAMRFNHLNIARLVSDADQFAAAASQPKETWGEPQRSLRMSKELEDLLGMRETLTERGHATEAIDKRIAAERLRVMRAETERPGAPQRAATLEITASRQAPQEQTARIVEEGGKLPAKPAPATKPPSGAKSGKGDKAAGQLSR